MNKFNFAIIGCGRIAERHANHIINLGKLAAVCDIIPEYADSFGEKYKANSYYSIDDLLKNEKELDVVSICTPNGLHAEHTIKALHAGCHVLCEKPMAIKVRDCIEMIKVSEQSQRSLLVVKQNRFNPPIAALKRVIDEGRLGRILSIQLNCFWNRNNSYYLNTWKGTRILDGGTLFTQFSHFIDLLYWMIGDVKKVRAFISNAAHQGNIEFEDQGVVILEFYNGAQGTINFTINSFGKNMEGSITVFGEKGTVKVGGQYLNELEYQNIENYKIKDLPPGNPPNNYGFYQGSMSNHDKVYQNVIDVLMQNGTIATTGIEGMKTVEIIEKIYKTANNE